MTVGLRATLSRIDERVLGPLEARAYARLEAPLDRDARAVWDQMSEDERQLARQAAFLGWVAQDPHRALVVADLVDQVQEHERPSRRWIWIGFVVVLAGLVIDVATPENGQLFTTLIVVGGAVGVVGRQTLRDRTRRQNLAVARAAGLR